MTGLRCGHRLRAVQERELAGRSRRTGRVQWGDGLAASAGLDRSGRLAAAARGPVGGTASRGPAGDGRRGHRWLARQGAQGGAHWTFAGRPCPPGQQAPPHRRPAWNPTRSLSDRRKPSRRHPAHAAAGRHPTHPRVTRPATQPPPATTSTSTAASSGLGDHTEDRPPRHPARFRAGQDQMGRRANLRLAASVQTTAHPLRDTRRPPPRTAPTRLQHHLLETTPNLILKRSVSHARTRTTRYLLQ